ncbi:MAG: hypothetical protein KY476_00495 [Planctomycetes bacterium]|nr:hypothetical protein [Planctomycetota bacterium]
MDSTHTFLPLAWLVLAASNLCGGRPSMCRCDFLMTFHPAPRQYRGCLADWR